MKKVLFLTLSPLDNDNRILKEIQSLQKEKYSITIVSINTNKKFDFESISFNFKSKKLFGIPGLSKLLLTYKYFKQIPKKKIFHAVHCHDLDAFVLGCIYQKMYNRKMKVIYDAHEYETETNGLYGLKKQLVKFLEKFYIKNADATITVSNAIANEYSKLYNIFKPSLVLNTPPYKEIKKKNIFRETLGISQDKTIFLYQGGLISGRGIEILLDTFKQIDDEKSVIVFMGYGSLEKLIIDTSKEYSNIYFHKAVSPDILLDYTSSADFGISTIEDSCLSYRYCLPNKMFEYIMAEVPVIVSNLYEMKRLVENNKIGIVAKDNTPDGLKVAIEEAIKLDKNELYNNISKVKKIYNWAVQESVLIKIYRELNI